MTIRNMEAKSVITCICVIICLVVTSVMLLGFVFPKQIEIVDSGYEMKVMTLGKTVEDIITEKGISLNKGDIISPSLDSSVKDGGTIKILRLKKLTFIADGNTSEIYSTADRAIEALSDAGITLGEFDVLSCSNEALLKDGMTISVIRSKKVLLNADGKAYEVYTTQPDVKSFLLSSHISLGEHDEVIPSLQTPITEGMQINVLRVTIGNEIYEEPVLRTVVEVPTPDLIQGQSFIIHDGADGRAKNTYAVVRKNGEVISKTLLNSETIAASVDQVVSVGTRVPAIAAQINYKKVISCTATAYESGSQYDGIPGITASGRPAGPGIIAVDPRVIPLGTRVYVESTDDGKSWTYGYAIAADTGGAIKGNIIDLCYNTYEECIRFGRRKCNVYILE